MGGNVSRPECNVPTRFLLGLDNARAVVRDCARHRIVYMWGFLLVTVLVILIAWAITYDRPSNEFKVPLWLAGLPLLLGLLYGARSASQARSELSTGEIELTLSGMSKRDYLNYKVGDDRTDKSFAASATSATILAGTNVLGPFLRADR